MQNGLGLSGRQEAGGRSPGGSGQQHDGGRCEGAPDPGEPRPQGHLQSAVRGWGSWHTGSVST